MQEQPPPQDLLKEMFRLERENNELLHGMRRRSFMLGIFKFIFYAALLLAPVWFYMTYLSGTLDTLVSSMNKLQGTNETSQQFEGFQNTLKQIQSRLPAFMQQQNASATTSSEI